MMDRLALRCTLAFAVVAASCAIAATTASAQAIVIIALCTTQADDEPVLSGLSVGANFEDHCAMPSEEDAAFCAAVDSVVPHQTTCADANAAIEGAGAELRAVDAFAAWPPPATGETPSGQDVATNSQWARGADVVYTLVAPTGAVRIVGCDFSDGVGVASFVQDSDDPSASETNGTCADALEGGAAPGLLLTSAARPGTTALTALGTTLSGNFDPPAQPRSDSNTDTPPPLEMVGFSYQKIVW